mmetsp:Transcript_24711/g.25132  ORF Transcript_24711/g.25132 Transcript_24711/m.25132 type:complete len:250 (-) Transcript_24711:342-1091(-)
MQSGRYSLASVGTISGFGLAMAKMTGSTFRLLTMVSVKTSAADTPMSTSAPTEISSRLVFSVIVAFANPNLNPFMPAVRPGQMTPRVSHTKHFSGHAPARTSRFMHAIPAAPAPLQIILISPIFLPEISSAFHSPARQMMAVPCWSSWKMGMGMHSFSAVSISKQSGPLMSSRLIPPKDGARCFTMSINLSLSGASTHRSMQSTPANFLKRTDLPSMTGLLARAPMLPRPSTAVPLVIHATILPLFVYL